MKPTSYGLGCFYAGRETFWQRPESWQIEAGRELTKTDWPRLFDRSLHLLGFVLFFKENYFNHRLLKFPFNVTFGFIINSSVLDLLEVQHTTFWLCTLEYKKRIKRTIKILADLLRSSSDFVRPSKRIFWAIHLKQLNPGYWWDSLVNLMIPYSI